MHRFFAWYCICHNAWFKRHFSRKSGAAQATPAAPPPTAMNCYCTSYKGRASKASSLLVLQTVTDMTCKKKLLKFSKKHLSWARRCRTNAPGIHLVKVRVAPAYMRMWVTELATPKTEIVWSFTTRADLVCSPCSCTLYMYLAATNAMATREHFWLATGSHFHAL